MKKWILLSVVAALLGSCEKERKDFSPAPRQTFALPRITTINTGDTSIFAKPSQLFFGDTAVRSKIYYRGNPPVTNSVSSGSGRIMHIRKF